MSLAFLLRAVRFPALACNRLVFAASKTLALQRKPRSSLPASAHVVCRHSVSTAMGAGGSKNGEGEGGGGGKKRSTKKSSKRAKETAAVATSAQVEVAAAGKEEGAGAEDYVECTVAKASEFGENE